MTLILRKQLASGSVEKNPLVACKVTRVKGGPGGVLQRCCNEQMTVRGHRCVFSLETQRQYAGFRRCFENLIYIW